MNKKTIGHAAGVFSALALMCASLMFASCDYWNEDWYKNGESETSSGYNMGGSDSSSSSSGSSSSSSGSSDSSDSSGTSSSDTAALTVTITGASGRGTASNTLCLYGTGGTTLECLAAVNGDTLTAVVKDSSGNTVTSGLTYQWLAAYGIDNAADGELQGLTVNWVEISGATSATYAVVQDSSDRWDIKVRVTQGSNVYYPDFSNYVRVPISSVTSIP